MPNQPSTMRSADVAVARSEVKLSGFRLISQGQVKLWKAMLVSVFLAGFVGALAFTIGFNLGEGSEAAVLPGSSAATGEADSLQYVWTPLEHNLPQVVGGPGVVFNNKFWVFGPVGGLLDDAVWWSEDGVKWNLATDNAAWTPRYELAATVFDGKMWISGGKGLRDQSVEDRFVVLDETITEDDFIFLNDVWWSVNGVDWHQATSSAEWAPRYEHQMVGFNGKLWIGPGIGGTSSDIIDDSWWSEDGVTWHIGKSDNPLNGGFARGLSPIVFRNKLWVAKPSSSPNGFPSTELWSSPDGDIWTLASTITNFSIGGGLRGKSHAVVFQDKLYLVGNGIFSSSDGVNWTKENIFNRSMGARGRLIAGVLNNKIFAVNEEPVEGVTGIWRLDQFTPLLGNVNADKVIDKTDAELILASDPGFGNDPDFPVGEFTKERIALGCGDVDKDGITDSYDGAVVLTFAGGQPVAFAVGKEVCPLEQQITLKPKFNNLISFNVLPQDRSVTNVFRGLFDLISTTGVSITTQNGGNILKHSPSENIFTLKTIEPERGYLVSIPTFEERTFGVSGASVTRVTAVNNGPYTYAAKSQVPINHIGFPYPDPHPVDVFFRSIKDKLVNVQDDAGNQYIPEFNVNTIGDMQPGKGYEVTVKEDVEFVFQTNFRNNLPNAPSSLTQSPGQEGSITPIPTPSFTLTISDPDQGQKIGYQIQVARDKEFTDLAKDFTWDGSPANPNDVRFKIHDDHALKPGPHWWRVRGMDDQQAFSDWTYFGDRDRVDLTVVMPGDVNQDGKITPGDAGLVAQHLAGKIELNKNQLQVAEVTGNDYLTAVDARVIFDHIYGTPDRLPIRFGDVDSDDRVTTADADLVLKLEMNMPAPTPTQRYVGDVSGDGKLDSYDALIIQTFASGQITEFPVDPRNNLPTLPSSLSQHENQGSPALSEGSTTADTTPSFAFTISDSDKDQKIGYQIQVAWDKDFTDLARDFTWDGSTVNPNAVRFDIRPEDALKSGPHWWRVMGTDETGAFSEWVYFGDRDKADFTVTVMPGDVTQDGAVTPSDAKLVAEYIQSPARFRNKEDSAALGMFTKEQRIAADVTGNGLITMTDSQVILDRFLGKLDRLPIRFGDVTKDGKLTQDDANLILEFSSGRQTPDAFQKYVGDVSADGKVTGYDSTLVSQFIAGKIKEFTADPVSVTHHNTIPGGATKISSFKIGDIRGGANQLYVAVVSIAAPQGVALSQAQSKLVRSVIGGGLTWQNKNTQCSGASSQEISIWTAYGSVQDEKFAINFELVQQVPGITVTVSRYTGVDPADPTQTGGGVNTNGSRGACAGGVPNKYPSVATHSSAQGSVRFVATGPRATKLKEEVKNYTQRTFVPMSVGNALYIHDFKDPNAGRSEFKGRFSKAADWVTAGLVIPPTPILPAQ